MSNTWSDWFTVVAGLAAAAALFFTVWETGWRQRRLRQEDVADKVVAWSVYEATTDGLESNKSGVLIVNASNEVALKVDIRTVAATSVGSYAAKGDEQRYGLIPPGTYYLPHADGSWSAPALVDTSDGKFAFTKRLEDGQPGVVHLVPITQRPESQRVSFLRFTISGQEWHRGVEGFLVRGGGTTDWDEAFTASESRPMDSVVAPHQPNQSVQTLIERLFRHLAVEGSQAVPNAAADVKPEFHTWGIRSLRRTRQRGQGLRLFAAATEDGPRFYISGGHDGSFPNDGLQLHDADGTVRDKRLFPVAAQSVAYWDAHFDELLDAIREGIERSVLRQA